MLENLACKKDKGKLPWIPRFAWKATTDQVWALGDCASIKTAGGKYGAADGAACHPRGGDRGRQHRGVNPRRAEKRLRV